MVRHFVVAFLPILVGGASRAAPPRREIVLGIDVGALNMKVSAAFPSGDRDQQVCTWFNRRLRRSALENGLQLHTMLFPSNGESRRSPEAVACDAQGPGLASIWRGGDARGDRPGQIYAASGMLPTWPVSVPDVHSR